MDVSLLGEKVSSLMELDKSILSSNLTPFVTMTQMVRITVNKLLEGLVCVKVFVLEFY